MHVCVRPRLLFRDDFLFTSGRFSQSCMIRCLGSDDTYQDHMQPTLTDNCVYKTWAEGGISSLPLDAESDSNNLSGT